MSKTIKRILSALLCSLLLFGVVFSPDGVLSTFSLNAHAASIHWEWYGYICYDHPLHVSCSIQNPGDIQYYLIHVYKYSDCTGWIATSPKLYYTTPCNLEVDFDLASILNYGLDSEYYSVGADYTFYFKLEPHKSNGSIPWTSTAPITRGNCARGGYFGLKEGFDPYGINYLVDGVVVKTQRFQGRHICSGTETISSFVPTKTGYTFLGWSTSGYNGPVTHQPGNNIYQDHNEFGISLYAVWQANTYVVKFNANGATSGSMGNQGFTYDVAQNLTANAYQRSHTVTYNYNGATGGNTATTTTATAIFNGWATSATGTKVYNDKASVKNLAQSGTFNLYANWTLGTVTLPTPTRTNYIFDGWYTDPSLTSYAGAGGVTYTPTANSTLYAKWSTVPVTLQSIAIKTIPAKTIYTVGESFNQSGLTLTAKYSDNSTKTITSGFTCSGFNSSTVGTKTITVTYEGKATTFTVEVKPQIFTITYNANGGSGAPASQSGNGTVKLSNTKPTRNGYTFLGWATNAGAASAQYQPGVNYNLTNNVTLFAVWKTSNIYNLGEETYSFTNYGDYDSMGGHCFGMSITSSGYYTGYLDKSKIGLTNTNLYAMKDSTKVRTPICHYQNIQGQYSSAAIVAGGSSYKTGTSNISADWEQVINYVKSHNYDDIGTLQIGYRKNGEGGHAINFLRYEEVNGQQRIYAYDNNFPNIETYFYKDSNGKVYQTPKQTFSGAIDCIALRDVATYYSLAGDFDFSRYFYAPKDTIFITGAEVHLIDAGIENGEYVMIAIPENKTEVIIKPLVESASFEYMDQSYKFNGISDETYGIFRLASMNEGVIDETLIGFEIYGDSGTVKSIFLGDVTLDYKASTTLKPQITADEGVTYTVKYESSNTKVATVDANGKVTGAKKGTATITCIVTDQYGNTVKDTCTVTVNYTAWQWVIIILLFGWIWY